MSSRSPDLLDLSLLPAVRTGEVTVSVIAGGASTGACSGWVGDVGALAARSPAPQLLTGVRGSTAPSLVVIVELPPAGSVPVDVMDLALAPPPTGASDGS